MADRVDTLVVGAGVVGLAIARRLAMAGCEVVVLEAADGIGTETSSRNSEVIHAGIYYPTGSLKARLCVAGKHALYDYCASHGVPHRRCGKLIAATDDAQAGQLAALQQKARDNQAGDLEWVERAHAAKLEPAVRCVAGLLSPSTGIVDSHALMLALQGDAEDHGAMIAFRAPARRGAVRNDGILIEAGDGGGGKTELLAERVVNSAGLGAQALARSIAGMPEGSVPPLHLARGVYFTMTGRNPFTHLVYPVPEPGGLGVHVTFDMGGQVRFGPDVEWIEEVDYTVDAARAERFYPAIRRYFPALADGALQPGYAGIRPKVAPRGAPAGDFIVQGPDAHGIAGLVNLYGIESPGLTASLAIADLVAAKLGVA